jgi:hypothetical protein
MTQSTAATLVRIGSGQSANDGISPADLTSCIGKAFRCIYSKLYVIYHYYF